ncbi:GNAT family N-acetyltransferase [uncultured Cyclobacterium sp.]|uniref:GNAT family N-acetyltransferase n=1 Tax=uncultured Cyclobacterium sp. TaxID=453820 RepID=UPI0030ED19F8
MKAEDFKLKKLDKEGLNTLVDWAATEGWNPGKYDFEVFWETDPDGYYGFFYEDKLIAGGAIISYNQEYGIMGLFIVRPDFREKGIGKKLWYLRRDLLIKRLHDGSLIGMDGVVAMQPFYEKGGFEIAFRDERLVEKYKAQYVFECARMYCGKSQKPDMQAVYGISTFELG